MTSNEVTVVPAEEPKPLTDEEKFAVWMEENQTALSLMAEQMASLTQAWFHYRIPPSVVYMHLKVTIDSMMKSMRQFLPKEEQEVFEKAKTELDKWAEMAVAKGAQMFSTLTNQANEYVKQTQNEPLMGYQ